MKTELEKLLKDSLAREILTFFYQNQTSIDTVGGVSAWVNDEREKVRSVLDRLARLGVLQKDSQGAMKGYCYTRDEKIMKIVKDLMGEV